MRVVLCVIAFGLIGFGLIGYRFAEQPDSVERLRFAPRLLELGEGLRQADCYFGHVKITNLQETAIQLKRVESSCRCTFGKILQPILAPGESTMIAATFRSGRSRGSVRQQCVLVYSDAESNAELRDCFYVIAHVTPEYEIDSAELHFDKNFSSEKDVFVETNAAEKLELAVGGISSPGLSVTVQALTSRRNRWLAHVEFDPTRHHKNIGVESISLLTGGDRIKDLRIPIYID